VAYLDDVTLGGTTDVVCREVERIRTEGRALGVELNDSKCEIISSSPLTTPPDGLENFKWIADDHAVLLGSPLLAGAAVSSTLQERVNVLQVMASRLSHMQAHDALVILRHSLSLPSMLHILRTARCVDHPLLRTFDEQLRQCLSEILNVSLDDKRWLQASLPIKAGGLGIRRAEQVAPSAFLASYAATEHLVLAMLPANLQHVAGQGVADALRSWQNQATDTQPTGDGAKVQRNWDAAAIERDKQQLLEHAQDAQTMARLRAVMSSHSGDWLAAPPISSVGLRMDNTTVRVAAALRLGAPICAPHVCICGSSVDARGTHGLSCTRSAGRALRHNLLNDIIHRALNRAQVAATREPSGLITGSGLRPDGVTTVPWKRGKCLAWDATVPDTLASSHVQDCALTVGAAATSAAAVKRQKYAALDQSHIVVPVAVETLGAWHSDSMQFIVELGHRLSAVTCDRKETAYLFQRLSVAIQRGNATSCLGSLARDSDSASA
jgi:hypothetical protein